MAVTEVKSTAQCDTIYKDSLAKKIPFVILFGAEWSGPSTFARDYLLKVSNNAKYAKVSFFYVNIDLCQGNAAGTKVKSIPHLIFYKNGAQYSELLGTPNEAQISEKVDPLL